jgi:cobalt/nickel transport system permease protein
MGILQKAAGIDRLEIFARRDSPVHRLHPGAKIAAAFAYSIAVLSFPSTGAGVSLGLSGTAVYVLYPAVLMSLSLTPWSLLWPRLLAALPFALFGALSNLALNRAPFFSVGAFTVTAGMLSFCSIMIKAFLAVLAVLLLIATTPFPAIIRELVRVGLPKFLGLQLSVTYRYMTALITDASSMTTAYMLRAPGGKGVKMKDMGSFLGQLLFRSFGRAERVYQAMKSRGFDGSFKTGAPRPFGLSSLLFVIVVIAAAIVFRFFNASLFLSRLAAGLMGGVNR